MTSVAVFMEAYDPTGKRAKAFRAAVESLRAQTLPPEVIHVTGSGGHERKAAGWGGVEYHTCDNAPLSAKRQASMEFALSSGTEYILCWGSDDLMMPDYIERVVDEMERTGADWGGVKKWWLAYSSLDSVILEQYEYANREDPMGAGRIYRSEFVRECCPRMWYGKKSYSLDRENADLLNAAGARCCSVDADIVLMKGPWESLTRLYHFRNPDMARRVDAGDETPIRDIYGDTLSRILSGPPSDIRPGRSLKELVDELNRELSGRARVRITMRGRDAQVKVAVLASRKKAAQIQGFAEVVSAQELPIQLMYFLNVRAGEKIELDCAEWTAAAMGAK